MSEPENLFQEIPDTINDENLEALCELDASDRSKGELYDAAHEFQRSKLEVVGEHLRANTDTERCTVEHTHPRGNGPSLSVIPKSDGQEAAIRELVEEIPDVDVIHQTGRWLNIA